MDHSAFLKEMFDQYDRSSMGRLTRKWNSSLQGVFDMARKWCLEHSVETVAEILKRSDMIAIENRPPPCWQVHCHLCWIATWCFLDQTERNHISRIRFRRSGQCEPGDVNDDISDIMNSVAGSLGGWLNSLASLDGKKRKDVLHRLFRKIIERSIRQSRKQHLSDSAAEAVAADATDLDDALDVREQVERLPETVRPIVELHLNDVSVGEIATRLNLSAATIYRRLEQAQEMLRPILQRARN